MNNQMLVKSVLFAMSVGMSAAAMAQGTGMMPVAPSPILPVPGNAPAMPGSTNPPLSNPATPMLQGPTVQGQRLGATNGVTPQGAVVSSPNGCSCAQIAPDTGLPTSGCRC